MYFQAQCSRCGHRSRKFDCKKLSMPRSAADAIISAGWNSFGDAMYCPACSSTWQERNGTDRPLWGAEHTRQVVADRMYDLLRDMMEDEHDY